MRSLHSLPLISLLIVAACVMACGGERRSETNVVSAADSIYTYEYIYLIHVDSPYKALALVDTAEQRNLLPPTDVNQLRSLVYFNAFQRFNIAAGYAKKSYESALTSQDTSQIMNVLNLYCAASLASGLYSDALCGARKGLELAMSRDAKSMQAGFLQSVALVYQGMGLREDCIKYLDQSIALYEECMKKRGANFDDAQEMLYCMFIKIDLMTDKLGRSKEAMALIPKAAATLDSMQKSDNTILSLVKQREIELCGLAARVFYSSGYQARAEEYYQKAFSIMDSSRHSNVIQMAPYLIQTHRYKEALLCVMPEKRYIEQSNDTLSHYFVEGVLKYERKALQGLGKYKEAAEVAERQIALNDSLTYRERKDQVAEQAAIFQTEEKELKLKEQAAELGRQRALIVGGAVALLLLVILAVTVFLYSRKIRRRNKVTVRSIEQMLEQQLELIQLRRINMVQTDNDALGELRGKQIEKYVNEQRMQQAVKLLKSSACPSLEEVAKQSGFSNVKAFSKQFEHHFGLTPAEYVKWCDRIQKKEGAMLDNARKMTEQAQEMKNSFIRNMSHEIRTPLNQISGFVQLLTDSSQEISDEEKQTFRDVIMEQTVHLTKMLNTLIELSDYDAGKTLETPMAMSALQLSAAFNADCMNLEGVERVAFRVEEPSVSVFHLSLSPVSRIVHVLVDNALKFAGKSTVDVLTSFDTASRKLTVSVTDHGKGIAAENAERIFERFCKLDDYVPGAGLGLTLARTIARRLGGTLVLDTTYARQGARFVLEVPVQE